MNVEWCNQAASIKYLFKYIHKGQDRITATFEKSTDESGANYEQKKKNKDEIKEYYDSRYISACEAAWRLLKFPIHYQYPNVERLSFHLPGEQPVVFEDDDIVDEVLSKPTIANSQFLKWMERNEHDTKAQKLTYVEFPKKYVWNRKDRVWTERKRGKAVGRINYVPSSLGELHYLRILLNKVKGPASFKELYTHDDVLYDTFKDRCYAMGLLQDDKEYIECIKETNRFASGAFCRTVFVMLLTENTLSKPRHVWEQTCDELSDDIQTLRRHELNMPSMYLKYVNYLNK